MGRIRNHDQLAPSDRRMQLARECERCGFVTIAATFVSKN